MYDRQIRHTIIQGINRFSCLQEIRKGSAVPGKASKVRSILSVPKTDTGGQGE